VKTILLLLLALLIVVGLWERSSLAGWRAQNSALREQAAAGQALLDENAAMTKQLDEAPATGGAGNKSELLRLRNEVRRLRSSSQDPALLRAENEKLAAELKSGKIRAPRLADEPGFVARENWANLGTATPEAALQSLFQGMRDGNIDLLLEVMPVQESLAMRRELEKDPMKMRSEFAKEAQSHFRATGYVITSSEEFAEGGVRLKVKFAAQSKPMDMEFQRMDGTWRMTKGFF
jgi:hypothetical protein